MGMSIRDYVLFPVLIVCFVPSHPLRSTVRAKTAFRLEEIAWRPGTGNLSSSLLLHPQHISSQDGGRKVAFLYL